MSVSSTQRVAVFDDEAPAGPWARRAALACALFTVPLVLFGGSVTTLGAGLAVEGWWIAEGHFLLFFPIEEWFRNTATFVEHTHRLFGILVGLCALACVALAWRRGTTRGARIGALAALLLVSFQGTLGGLRVLEQSSNLAFLHGALAQLVFAALCVNAVLFSRGWRDEQGGTPAVEARRGLALGALAALLATYAQAVLGAWYRHGLRPVAAADSGLRFLLHGVGALLVLVSLAALMRRAAVLRASEPRLPAGLERALKVLPVLLILQLVLGGLAWAGFRPSAIGPAEWLLSIAHVLGGAVLLADLAVITLWSCRLARATRTLPSHGRAILGEAR